MLWCTTPTGKKWSFLNPDPDQVDIQDIAINLARQVRYNGSCGQYTIAEHSVHIHDEALKKDWPDDWCLLALLHDAHEAYIGDWITPAVNALSLMMFDLGDIKDEKAVSRAVGVLKNRTDSAIFAALGLNTRKLPGAAYHGVKRLDAGALMTERDYLMPTQPESWGAYETIARLSFEPKCWDFEKARAQFLNRFARYAKKDIAA
jgi:hypothetical protein